ncbi:MAG: 50S ribosomal protein L18 [Patescibacteria group bacterium]
MKDITFNRTTRRKRRVSMNMHGTGERPRISVHKSNKFIYAQAIDDDKKVTVASFSSLQLARKKELKGKKSEQAKEVGIQLAKTLKEKKVLAGIFDRGRYTYNGRVKSLAEGLREGELKI